MNVFEKIIHGILPANIIKESRHSIIIQDIKPVARIHYLLISKKLYIDLGDFLNNASLEEKNDYFDQIKILLNELKYAKVQFNCGELAGQEIMHLHAHIIQS